MEAILCSYEDGLVMVFMLPMYPHIGGGSKIKSTTFGCWNCFALKDDQICW